MGEDHHQIMKLQTQSTALQRKTEAETQRLNEMVALARQVERKIHEQRSDRDRVRSGGVYASKTTTLRATLKHGQLETRRAGLNRKAAQVCLKSVYSLIFNYVSSCDIDFHHLFLFSILLLNFCIYSFCFFLFLFLFSFVALLTLYRWIW